MSKKDNETVIYITNLKGKTTPIYYRLNIYEVDEILEFLKDSHGMKYNNYEGFKIKTSSMRMQTFYTKGCECCKCKRKGKYFALERSIDHRMYHLNLYGFEDGKEILFTKDHITPKSKGGKDKLENFQTMCVKCNQDKADKIE